MANVLIVDDHPELLRQLTRAFAARAHRVLPATTGEEAVQVGRREKPHAAVMDLSLPGLSGDGAFAALKTEQRGLIGVAISGVFRSVDAVRRSRQAGFAAFIAKPLDPGAVVDIIEGALAGASDTSHVSGPQPAGMIGDSPAMQEVYRLIPRIARTDATVLIEGETGTGKELVAAAIHASSRRSAAPFVAVNCGGLPRELLESELFGSEKGAFTGATHRPGYFEQANGGSLFLDEIGALSSSGQAVLLRALDRRVVQRLGGRKDIVLNVRVIAATNADLPRAVEARGFRADLLYRLRRSVIRLPPLRQRGEDVLQLAHVFLRNICSAAGVEDKSLSPEAERLLLAYAWPGNVREVEDALTQAVDSARGPEIRPCDLPNFMRAPTATFLPPERPSGMSLVSASAQLRVVAEKHWIESALGRSRTMADAAKELGINSKTLYEKVRKYCIRIPSVEL